MDRRDALKSMALSVWGMMVLPACGPQDISKPDYRLLPLDNIQENNLEALVETIIPKSDTPGAADLKVHEFINRLLANCHEEEDQMQFMYGLDLLEERSQAQMGKSFHKLDQEGRETLFLTMDNDQADDQRQFFNETKDMCILGYTTSEHFLTQFTKYEMVPGGYEGCIPVPDEPVKV